MVASSNDVIDKQDAAGIYIQIGENIAFECRPPHLQRLLTLDSNGNDDKEGLKKILLNKTGAF